MNELTNFIIWLAGVVVVFVMLCIVNRKRESPLDKDSPFEVILISLFWPAVVALLIGVAPLFLIVRIYEKASGSA